MTPVTGMPYDVDEPFRVVLADPGWDFGDKLSGPGRGAAKHYETGSVADIIEAYHWLRPEHGIVAEDAVLPLWRVASMQREALDVAEGWGFTVKSEVVWLKRTVHGKRHFGMGRQVRMEHEVCLIATRGKVRAQDMAVRSTFMECGSCGGEGQIAAEGHDPECPDCKGTGLAHDAEVLEAIAGGSFSAVLAEQAPRKHSAKPPCFRRLLARLYPGPYLEVFARERTPGWYAHGYDVVVACVVCGEEVPHARKWPHWSEPTCYACLPGPDPLPIAPLSV